ncbi:MAG TPA: hypothetical protein VKA26_05335 [Ignavibacteriaceae bacterium]|nr:hypothetical protein [Ignavibacteriaceae bacterium]
MLRKILHISSKLFILAGYIIFIFALFFFSKSHSIFLFFRYYFKDINTIYASGGALIFSAGLLMRKFEK